MILEHFKKGGVKSKLVKTKNKVLSSKAAKKVEKTKVFKKADKLVKKAEKTKIAKAMKKAAPIKKLTALAKKAPGKAKEAALKALLIPYKPLMTVLVKKKGVKPEKDVLKLAKQFYQVVMKGKHYDEQAFDSYLRMNMDETGTSLDFNKIVSAIVKYLTGLNVHFGNSKDPDIKKALSESEQLAKEAMTDADGNVSTPAELRQSLGAVNEGRENTGAKPDASTVAAANGIATDINPGKQEAVEEEAAKAAAKELAKTTSAASDSDGGGVSKIVMYGVGALVALIILKSMSASSN